MANRTMRSTCSQLAISVLINETTHLLYLNLLMLLVRLSTISRVYCRATWLTSRSSLLSTRICCFAFSNKSSQIKWPLKCLTNQMLQLCNIARELLQVNTTRFVYIFIFWPFCEFSTSCWYDVYFSPIDHDKKSAAGLLVTNEIRRRLSILL